MLSTMFKDVGIAVTMNALLVQKPRRDGQVTLDITRSLYCKSDNTRGSVRYIEPT